ncbi:MAG TPA: S8 family serine peptidase, partial [Pyrinomonadaceae bacterium]|nr:S8 family serine peptidase [Pyrinomonadaceae bacterium]
ALFDAIDLQRQRGILFITAAGNGDFFGFPIDNDQSGFYPCTYYLPNIICVASTTRTDARSSFSNYGRRTVHIGAPGTDILSTTRNGNYGFSSGTSMATPHVSGVAALLKAQDPNRDWRAIKNLILTGADNVSSMSNTITQKRLNANGASICNNSTVLSRVLPIAATLNGAVVGEPVNLGALHINCANPNGDVVVTVNPGGESVTLKDDGLLSDTSAGDGIYSGQWIPPVEGNFTLTFPNGDHVSVTTANALISISPVALDFAGVSVGNSAQRTIIVKNVGNQSFSGQATTEAPFSIIAGGSYTLTPGQSQSVTIGFTPPALGSFEGNINFTGGIGATARVTGIGAKVDSITPNNVDLAAPPLSFTIQGSGFANLGYGLPVVNWQRNGVNIAQARATAMTSTTLTVPYPTDATSIGGPRPGLSVGSATVVVYNQSNNNEFIVIGTLPFTITDSTPAPSVTSITPSSVDLASPPSSFTVQGAGFKDFGYGLPLINWQRNGVNIAQARATTATSTSLTVPYPTNATSIGGPRPGLSVGSATVVVYHQTGANSFSVIGTLPFTITDSNNAPPSVTSITPNSVDLAAPPASFTVQGSSFKNFGYGLPVVNWQRNGVNIAQARATAMTATSLTVPYPTNATSIGGPRPGLSVGSATVVVYHQTGANSFTAIGTLPFTITDSNNAPPSVTSITPNSVDLAAPPASFTVQGSGFKNFGYGLPVVNWQRNGVNIAQARATAMTSTTLTVPYPTNATSIGGPRPGLSVGSATVVVYHQTGANSFSVIGTLPFTITNSQNTN